MPALADRDAFESSIVLALAPIFRDQYERASEAPGPNVIPYAQFQADLQSTMSEQLFQVFTAAGYALIIGQALVVSAGAFEESARQWSAKVSREIAASVVDTSQRMTADLYRLSMGDREKFRQGLEAVYLSPARLNAIAVTETTRATSQAERSVVFFFRQDRQVRLIPVWITVEDAPGIPATDVCAICAPFDRHTPEVYGREFPHGPPGHVHCVLPFNRISIPGTLLAAVKSFYDGPCIEIALANGRKLSVTMNHPILTDRGWIPAKLIDERRNVFCAVDGQRIALLLNPNNENVPTIAEQVFCAAKKRSAMLSGRMPTSAEDFHGDGRFIDGDVEIVYPNGPLLTKADSPCGQHCSEFDFRGRCSRQVAITVDGSLDFLANSCLSSTGCIMCGREHGRSRSFVRTPPTGNHRVRNSSRLYAGTKQSFAKRSTANANLFGQRLLRFAGNVPRDDRGRHVDLSGLRCLCVASKGNPELNQPIAKAGGVHTNLASQFCTRFAALISLNKVVNVRIFEYSGHVYDFQSSPYELFMCNDAIVHNCRCHLQWIDAAEWARRAA